MILTFKNGTFLLREGSTTTLLDLQAAAEFRKHSDSEALKVFNRAFNCDYVLPLMPQQSTLKFLDSHQREGVEWILTRKRSYLAHAPGAGKTAQTIVADYISGGKSLFIVPPSLVANWQREIEKFYGIMNVWAPTEMVVPLSNKQKEMNWEADIIICPDSMLTRPWVYRNLLKRRSKFIAVDEASRFKEPTAVRSRVLYGGVINDKPWPGLYQDARHVVFLDGSPMPNRPMELWAPTYALDPEAIDCMSQQDFGFRYCGATLNDYSRWEFNHSANESELKDRLQKRFMHVVREEELSHPERRRSIIVINRDTRTHEQKAWEQRFLSKNKLEDITEDSSQGDLAAYRRELGVSKIPFIAGYIQDRLDAKNESILLFAWHREVCEELVQRLSKFNPGLIIGGVPNDTREKIFSEFQSKKRRLIVGNIAAMGRGNNLQSGDRVVFGEYSWTDQLNMQCEKRISRRGKNKDIPVPCDYLTIPNSLDEKILRANFTKQTRVRRVIG